MKYEVHYTVGC